MAHGELTALTRGQIITAHEEGYSPTPYIDTTGNWTVGVGEKIKKATKADWAAWKKSSKARPEIIAKVFKPNSALSKKYLNVGKAVHAKRFRANYSKAMDGAKQVLGSDIWEGLSPRWRDTLTDLTYQVGRGAKSKTYKLKVRSGDTLLKIAKVHGTSVDELARNNSIKDKNKIQLGQTIKISKGSTGLQGYKNMIKALKAGPDQRDKAAWQFANSLQAKHQTPGRAWRALASLGLAEKRPDIKNNQEGRDTMATWLKNNNPASKSFDKTRYTLPQTSSNSAANALTTALLRPGNSNATLVGAGVRPPMAGPNLLQESLRGFRENELPFA